MTETAEKTSARPPLREDDPRARAAKRAAELVLHGIDEEVSSDKFAIPPEDIPDGWTYEWKTDTVLGQENPAYQVQIARAGWEAVPLARHPSYMPRGHKGSMITRDGMVLMERPTEIVERAKAREYRNARDQVRQKEIQLGAAPDGQFRRADAKGDSLATLGKSYEHIPIPD